MEQHSKETSTPRTGTSEEPDATSALIAHLQRELEIEAALERVRARTMAMRRSDELSELVKLLYKEIEAFGVSTFGVSIAFFREEENAIEYWFADHLDSSLFQSYRVVGQKHPVFRKIWEAWKNHSPQIQIYLENEEKWDFDTYQFEETDFRKLPEVLKHDILIYKTVCLTYTYTNFGYFESVDLSIPDEESTRVLIRFAKVFEQTYTRFLDLQKAEAQAREAEIQLALERVRARTMAMQKTDELRSVIHTVFEQLKTLDFDATACGLTLFKREDKSMTLWLAGFDTDAYPESYFVPYFDHPMYNAQLDAWESGTPYQVFRFEGESKRGYDKLIFELGDFKYLPSSAQESILSINSASNCTAFMKYGMIESVMEGDHVITEQQANTLQRFAKVFEQTYTRFLDLQKAEAQAREAQIEAALERVRARTMGMYRSDELAEISGLLYRELVKLGINESGSHFVNCGFVEVDENNQGQNGWTTMPDGSQADGYYLPLVGDEVLNIRYDAWKNQVIAFHQSVSGVELQKHLEFVMPTLGSEQIQKLVRENFPDPSIFYCFNFKQGYLHLITGKKFSAEQEAIMIRFAKVFAQTYTRFLDIQKAEAQAREAQIEAALERVRARSMAMHKSDELSDCAELLFIELSKLGGSLWTSGFAILQMDPNSDGEYRTTDQFGTQEEVTFIPNSWDPTMKYLYEGWKQGEIYRSYILGGEEIKSHYANMLSLPRSAHVFQVVLDSGQVYPEWQQMHAAYFKQGYLLVISLDEYHDADLLVRFAKVFEQTYTRFLDLQKAEAQAREAQIEAALERVRSRTMGMNKSDELAEVVALIYKEIREFELADWGCNIQIFNEAEHSIQIWISAGMNDYLPKPYYFRTSEHEGIKKQWIAFRKKEDYFLHLQGKEKKSYDDFVLLNTDFKHFPEEMKHGIRAEDKVHFTGAFMKYGFIVSVNLAGTLNHEQFNLLSRFARVFEQTYTRFLDIKKAEAQAREAQIEAALERVRARTMAMHHSDELGDVAIILYKVFNSFNMSEFFNCGFMIVDEVAGIHNGWLTQPEGTFIEAMDLPYPGDEILLRRIKAWKERTPVFCDKVSGEELENHKKYVKDQSKSANLVNSLVPYLPDPCYFYCGNFTQGYLHFVTKDELSQDDELILSRFAKVFEQTYTRFLDLQKAEAQAREATKQASLDRVRAEIASMRSANDLQRITPLIWHELTILGVNFIRCGVFIIDELLKTVHLYLSTPEGHSLAALDLPYGTHSFTDQVVAFWRNREVYRDHWDQKQFVDWMQSMIEQHRLQTQEEYLGAAPPPESLYLNFIPFKQGMLYVGNTEELSTEEIDLVQTLATAFSIAYARYDDFRQLEQAKTQIESTLDELKLTQAQLIQSEKMASLGELTAGIAHEIQNPLNFVNNYSEVSRELIEDLRDAETNGESDKDLEKEIIQDLDDNLAKIYHHGKRAEAIVRGMLLHSRKNSGTKEPTDLNTLVYEYFRLAFQGMRAKDESFEAECLTDFDPNLPLLEVAPSEIGRALLNIINNAFQAVQERSNQREIGYQPAVKVTTKKLPLLEGEGWGEVKSSEVQITITDNGPGIPEAIKDKIFQPFFTTKPTGQGTGLGLSLAYDIVKAHGGELRVETQEGVMTEFIITIPMESKHQST